MIPTGNTEVIYEVECSLDPAVVEAFDAWLPDHVREVLACEGFTGAEIQAPLEGADGRVLRRTQYRAKSIAALEHYIEQDAPRMRADGAARFGDKVAYSRRVLRPRALEPDLQMAPLTCQNCGSAVTGKYCPECGQAGHVHVLTIGDVTHDVVHSVLHLDSRVWRTLRSLILKPGELTNEFIAGRRASYLPPFRLYLVISVAFFALSALLPEGQMLSVNSQGRTVIAIGAPPPPVEDQVTTADSTAAADGQTAPERAARQLRQSLDAVKSAPDAPEAVRRGAELAAGAMEDQNGQAACNVDIDLPVLKRLNPLLTEACRKVRADGGRRLGEVFLSAAPRLMFLFLPLMAGVVKLFYWKPRRLYAEHVVAFLHSHAFLFLVLTLNSIVNATMSLDLPLVSLLGVVTLALMAYVPYYVFRAMRVVYREGRVRTLVKFTVLSLLYFALLGITIVIGIFYSMLSL